MKKLLLTFLIILFTLSFNVGCSGGSGDLDKGIKAYENGDYKTAVREWKPLAEKGDAIAQHKLGRMYRDGKGVSKDDKTAVKWFRLGAEQGYAGAQTSLGWMYSEGRGAPKDDKTAVKWFRLGAEQGNAAGQTNLGFMYSEGNGVPQNYDTAIKWYKLAAAQGDDVAQFNLGNHYLHGEGVPQNYDTAIKWYKLAAAQGYDKAIHNLKLIQSRQDSLKTQQEFIQIIKSAKRKFNQNSEYPAAQGKVLYDRTKEICALMTSSNVYNWVGKVSKVETNEDGWGVLEIELDTNLRLSTRDNVYGDYGSNTLINPGSDLFESFMYLKRGDKIKFSGNFFKEDREKGTCLNLMNGTLSFRVLKPTYEFKFTKINKTN